jgi:hypothetical protein
MIRKNNPWILAIVMLLGGIAIGFLSHVWLLPKLPTDFYQFRLIDAVTILVYLIGAAAFSYYFLARDARKSKRSDFIGSTIEQIKRAVNEDWRHIEPLLLKFREQRSQKSILTHLRFLDNKIHVLRELCSSWDMHQAVANKLSDYVQSMTKKITGDQWNRVEKLKAVDIQSVAKDIVDIDTCCDELLILLYKDT